MTVQEIISAIKHNSLFTHRYVNTCQLCGKLEDNTLSYRPERVELYIESNFGDLIYCSSCKKN